MAQRPESRAVKPTRARKARQPVGDLPTNAAVPAAAGKRRAQRKEPADIVRPVEVVQAPPDEPRPLVARPSRTRPVKAKTQPAEAVGAAAPVSPPKLRKAKKTVATQIGEQAVERAGKDASRAKPARKSKRPLPYLAAELGQPVDHEGEPIGAGSPMARADTELQEYTLQLWQQMQSRRGVNQHIRAMEHAGLTVDDLWATGVTGKVSTSSTPDEVRRYRQNLLFRANLLEAILLETVSELRRLESVEPTSPSANGSA